MNIFGIMIFCIFIFALGLFIGIYIKKQETERLIQEKNTLKIKNDELAEQAQNLTNELSAEKTKLDMLSEIQKNLLKEKDSLMSKKDRLSEQIQQLTNELSEDKTKLDMLSEMQKLIKEDFTVIANKVIKEEQSDLREQNREAIEEKLKPLKENFDKFREKVEEFNKQGENNTAVIKTQIQTLVNESLAIKTTANDLSSAIKANSQVRGAFGEMILENLLQQAGLINKNDDMEKGNYITQHTFTDLSDLGTRPRPDAVVFFPDNKHIIIDSKCPLNNFVEFINSKDDSQKQAYLNLFYKSVTDMIEELSSKYNSLEGLNTPEFKLMFIPLESCASYIYTNSEITTKAAKQNIVLVCPSTLLATLKIINKTWVQKNQAENLDKILKTATAAYDKLVLFIKKSEEIRKNMASVQTAFESLFTTTSGRGGLIKQIEGLRELGIHIKTKVDEKYLTENTAISTVIE